MCCVMLSLSLSLSISSVFVSSLCPLSSFRPRHFISLRLASSLSLSLPRSLPLSLPLSSSLFLFVSLSLSPLALACSSLHPRLQRISPRAERDHLQKKKLRASTKRRTIRYHKRSRQPNSNNINGPVVMINAPNYVVWDIIHGHVLPIV